MNTITSKQRAYLKSQANSITAIFQIGKLGTSDTQIQQIKDALEARELIKLSVLETAPASAKALGEEIAKLTDSILVQVVGNKITLFKKRTEGKPSKFENL